MIITCQNAGCFGPRTFEYTEKQQEHHAKMGWDAPRSCPACRAWKRAQEDIGIIPLICTICGVKHQITPGQRIMHHKNEGRWENPNLCSACKRDPERAEILAILAGGVERFDDYSRLEPHAQATIRQSRATRARASLEAYLESVQEGDKNTNVVPLDILDEPDAYRSLGHHSEGTYYTHIMENTPNHMGHAEDLKAAFDVESDTGVFSTIRELCEMPNPERIAEFRERNGDVVKYDKKTSVVIITKSLEDGPPYHHVRTSFVMNPGQAVNKVVSQKWKPL